MKYQGRVHLAAEPNRQYPARWGSLIRSAMLGQGLIDGKCDYYPMSNVALAYGRENSTDPCSIPAVLCGEEAA